MLRWARQDSNLRPSDYESPALTAAPRALLNISSASVFSVTQHGHLKRDTEALVRAGDGIRTHEYQLGRLMPYHLATPA